MNKLSILSLFFVVIIFSFYACKKDEPIEKKLIGTWELNKITFLESNVSYPLDSFRNLINVNLKLNGDFSFNETEDFGKFTIGPLGSTVIEDYTTPRNAKARYIIEKYFREYETSKYSISGDSISFYYKFKYGALFYEEKHNKKFVLKSDKELDIERLDLLIHNKNIPSTGYHKLRLSYTKK